MFINVSADIRENLVRQLVDEGCDSTIAREAIDLASHAIDVAIEAVKTTCQRASLPQVMIIAHPLALHLLSAAAEGHAEAAETAVNRVAKAMGISTVVIDKPGKS